MFVGRPGRTIGAKSNISHLYASIYNELLKLPPPTIIYSGHHYGYKTSIALKENISLSSFFQCTSKDEFIAVMDQFEKNRRRSWWYEKLGFISKGAKSKNLYILMFNQENTLKMNRNWSSEGEKSPKIRIICPIINKIKNNTWFYRGEWLRIKRRL